jgi:putative aldouronate transport system substrate-binding protein
MKFIKMVLWTVTAAAALVSVAGCGGSGSAQAPAGSTSGSGGRGQPVRSSSQNVNGLINEQSYPIVDSKISLDFWYPMAGSMGELTDFNEAEFFQWYEEKTKIHINFIVPPANSERDAFNLLFASDNMPDMIYSTPNAVSAAQAYRGGEDKAIEDGYFINMAEYLQFAPNYVSWIVNGQETGLSKAVYTDKGNLYGLWGIWEPMNRTVMPELGIAVRKDFLDKVNKQIPTTYDEWYSVLTAFRDQLKIEAPFYTSKFGIDATGEFMAGYGTAPYFYQVDGKVKYGPLDDAYRDYLTMLNKWYNEGLLDRDFPTRASIGYSADNDMMLNDRVGSLIDWATRLSETYVSRGASNRDFYLVAAPQPKKTGGQDPRFRSVTGGDQLHEACIQISTDSKYIEQAIRWVDGFYAKDVYLNANYGLDSQKGVVWQEAPDGHRIGDYDFRYANPNKMSSATVLVKYWVKNPPLRVEAAQIEQADANKQSAYRTWASFDADWVISGRTTMTADESTKYSSIYTDIETYVQECNVKFITGSMSLSTYDSYRDTLRRMNIEEAVALRQAALDRFLKR